MCVCVCVLWVREPGMRSAESPDALDRQVKVAEELADLDLARFVGDFEVVRVGEQELQSHGQPLRLARHLKTKGALARAQRQHGDLVVFIVLQL